MNIIRHIMTFFKTASQELTLATIISLLRLLFIIPIVVAIMTNRLGVATILFICAGITDIIDGYIARYYNQITQTGALIDALVDKCLIMSTLIGVMCLRLLPTYLYYVILISIAKEILQIVIVACLVFSPMRLKIEARLVGKLNMCFQVLLVMLLLNKSYLFLVSYQWVIIIVMSVILLMNIIVYGFGLIKLLNNRDVNE